MAYDRRRILSKADTPNLYEWRKNINPNEETRKLVHKIKSTKYKRESSVKQEIEDKELVSEKIDVPLSQKFFNRVYFSISTGTLLGYGDIYPTTNICKLIAMIQSLFTIALIVY